MADRFWVGGTASWDATAGTKWAATSGGAGGVSVPTTADAVFFDAASGANTITVAAAASCLSLNFTGFTGTFAGTSNVTIAGSLTAVTDMTWTHSGTLSFNASSGSYTITTAGKTIGGLTTGLSSGTSTTWTLVGALSVAGTITVTRGNFNTANYGVTASALTSSNSNTRSINLGSSAVALSSAAEALSFLTSTGLTFTPGTSTISLTSVSATFVGGGRTFATVNFTSTGSSSVRTISGANTFTNLGFNGRGSSGIGIVEFAANQTITGTFTIAPGATAYARTFYRSDIIGIARTITAGTFATGSAHADFRDIVAGGANFNGTGFGNCKGNVGIQFTSAKTVYWRADFTLNWADTLVASWALTDGAQPSGAVFPLAQDTIIFASRPSNGATVTVNGAFNIGTIDMSARTSSTMTLSTGAQTISVYGNWINGTGTTIGGTGILYWTGRNSQSITSAGKTFTQVMRIESPGGYVSLSDAFTYSNNVGAFLLTTGTFNTAGYSLTLTGASSGTLNISGTSTRSLQIGSSTITIAASGNAFNAATSTNLTVSGTGTINLTSASAKTFAGGNIQTYPTLNQGGTGALTVSGSNRFLGITNTAIGSVLFTGGTTNQFSSFGLNGTSTSVRLTIGSTNTTQVTLKKPTSWNVGTGSLDSGNNTGISFTAGDNNFLAISYVIGQVAAVTYTGNFFAFF